MKKQPVLVLGIILLLGLVLRLYKIDIPLADHHSWRQADTAAVIRNLATSKLDPLRPRWDNLMPTNAQNLPNPERLFFEDFPLGYDVYPALLYKIFGVKEFLARAVTILFSLGAIIFLYLLVKKMADARVALWTAFFYAVLPFSVFFSRTILQEPTAVFYLVASFFVLTVWRDRLENKGNLWLVVFSGSLLSLGLLTKIYLVFFLPLALYLFWQKQGLAIFKSWSFYLFWGVVFVPVVLWWYWIYQHPEGIPYSAWLLNEGNIRFKGAWFYWLFAERIAKLILGFWGTALFVLGLISKAKKEKFFFHLWMFCLILFFVVFAKGNVTHDYYQYLFLPVGAVFLAKGVVLLSGLPKKYFNRLFSVFAIIGCIGFMLAFSWYFVRDFYNIKSGVDLAGRTVDQLTLPEDRIIAGDGADSTLLYNVNRVGWAIGFGALYENKPEIIEKLIDEGAKYYVTTKVNELKSSDFGQYMNDNFSVVKETDQFILFDLRS